MAEDEVDDLLEEAFKNVDEAEKNGTKMDDIIKKKAKEVGIKYEHFTEYPPYVHSIAEKKTAKEADIGLDLDVCPYSPLFVGEDEERRERAHTLTLISDVCLVHVIVAALVPGLGIVVVLRLLDGAPALGLPLRSVVHPRPVVCPGQSAGMLCHLHLGDHLRVMLLARQTRPRDLEEFFSSVGHVRDVRVITDTKTRRSKGIAYVEFWERDAVPLAMGLSGQKLHGAPLVIQMTCAERNRAANAVAAANTIGLGLGLSSGPLQLCVNNLHPNITDDMLAAIFEPFGRVERCYVRKDPSDLSNGTGYVTFRHAEEGRRAMEQLNGFELAGRNIRLTTVDENETNAKEVKEPTPKEASLESEDRNVNSSSRLQLIANLAKGKSDVELPKVTQEAIAAQQAHQQNADKIPIFATQCFMLTNMFDPSKETEPGWDLDIRDDVIEECTNHGGCVHVYIDKASPQGNVYVKCPTVAIAHKSVVALHGRWFAGKVITANYVPVASYHELFPDARTVTALLQTRPAN
uniref:RRM domain-containing protein n=1 Tax=Globodera pallida TaxID=36090 RepID=A0A183CMF7_GLOPA